MVYFIFLLYTFLVFVRPQDYMLALSSFPIMPLTLAITFLGWLSKKNKIFNLSPIKNVIAFVMAIVFSLIAEGLPGMALNAFAQFLPILLIFLMCCHLVDTEQKYIVYTSLIVISSIIMAFHGVDQRLNGVGWTGAVPVQDGRITYIGIFNDPNDLGLVFLISIPLLLNLRKRSSSFLLRTVHSLALLLIGYGIVLTNSRGTLLGMMFIIFAYSYFRFGKVKVMVTGFIALPILVILMNMFRKSIQTNNQLMIGWHLGMRGFKC